MAVREMRSQMWSPGGLLIPRQFHQIQHHRKHHTPQLLGTTKPTGTDDDSVRTKGWIDHTDTSKQVSQFS